MIARAIDGRFLGHPFFFPSKKNGHGNGCRQRPNSYNPNSLYRYITQSSPGALCAGSGALSLCVGAKRCLHQAPALSVSGPGRRSLCRALCRGLALSCQCVRPGALCVGARPNARARYRALSALGSGRAPGALCVGARRSPPPLSVSDPTLFVRGRSSGPGRCLALCVRPRRSLCRAPALSVSGPSGFAGPQRRSACSSACHPSIQFAGPRPSSDQLRSAWRPSSPGLQLRSGPIRSAGPQLRYACHPSSGAFPFSGENPKPYCLGDNTKIARGNSTSNSENYGSLGAHVYTAIWGTSRNVFLVFAAFVVDGFGLGIFAFLYRLLFI